MKLATLLVLVAPFILGETFAVSHLKCGGVEYELPQVDSARAKCLGVSDTTCRIRCTFVNMNMLNEDNQVNQNVLYSWLSSFSKGLYEAYESVPKNCLSLVLNISSHLDAGCSAFEPYLSCSQEHIAKQCEILAPSVFS